MTSETLYKTVYQYNRNPISAQDMARLQEIAEDCRKVRNYVYDRYGGIGGFAKLYPGYTVQNEMTKSGMRESLGLPSVYFYLSIFDALGDIKSHWSRAKSRIKKNIQANEGFTSEDRHYLRFVMKQSSCFEAILAGKKPDLQGDWIKTYESVCTGVNVRRLDQYLRRQVRRHLTKPHTDTADGFSVSPKGYRYADHGIYLAMKESRQRLFILLTDNNHYNRQIYIRLYPEKHEIIINVPVEVKTRHPAGYEGEIGLVMGMRCMLVTDRGNTYGERYLEYQSALTDYVRKRLSHHKRNAVNNPGMKKYSAGKAKLENTLHSYINSEINRMLEMEKPGIIYLPRLPATTKAGVNRKINAAVSMWQKGYVRNRLLRKCRERSVELVEVYGKGISTECCRCGTAGVKEEMIFYCPSCGFQVGERENAAGNALKRGRAGKSASTEQTL